MASVSQVESREWDLDRYTERPSVYVVASQPRSGSHYLAALLRQTGSAGVPLEYFHTAHWNRWVKRCHRSNPLSAFRLLCQVRTTPNGVFGVKAHWRQFEMLCHLRLESEFFDARFVEITRHDTLGQAISLVIASQTGSWIGGQAAQSRPEFSVPAIQSAISQILIERSGWDRFFAYTGIEPLRVSYERLVENPDETLCRVCEHIGAQWTGVPGEEVTHVQRSQLSDEWRQRFLATLPTLHEDANYWRGQFGSPWKGE